MLQQALCVCNGGSARACPSPSGGRVLLLDGAPSTASAARAATSVPPGARLAEEPGRSAPRRVLQRFQRAGRWTPPPWPPLTPDGGSRARCASAAAAGSLQRCHRLTPSLCCRRLQLRVDDVEASCPRQCRGLLSLSTAILHRLGHVATATPSGASSTAAAAPSREVSSAPALKLAYPLIFSANAPAISSSSVRRERSLPIAVRA